MRRPLYRGTRDAALALLARSRVVHLATTTPVGDPILRTVHGVLVDDRIAFHGAPAGEKLAALGRPAVLSAEEIVAEIPSYFTDPERACPATTYYRSVQVHGPLTELTDPIIKARVLQALMTKYQPEGGHVPITAEDPRYRKQVEGIMIVALPLDHVDCKDKLGQNRKPDEMSHLLAQLWARGLPGDPAAIEVLRAANPATPDPAFLHAPAGARLSCALEPDDAAPAAALLAGTYWNLDVPADRIARAHLGAGAWVGAHDERGDLIASARAVGDGAKWVDLRDVVVTPAWRGRGLGLAVVRLILDHPFVRRAHAVTLHTRDAMPFYERFGFGPAPTNPNHAMRRLATGP
jgi:nitroimidazol reductase NimA-like FMN-containing flavoprotein (pyridoxamine 5'-phosphate oxidase superfamily)/GNAT superfamily N-acetyltransferase